MQKYFFKMRKCLFQWLLRIIFSAYHCVEKRRGGDGVPPPFLCGDIKAKTVKMQNEKCKLHREKAA